MAGFSFWFELLKTLILPILYPAVCTSIGILKEDDGKIGDYVTQLFISF